MKKIKNIILGLVCGLGLFAATMSTTVTATEPLTVKFHTCITVCGNEACQEGGFGSLGWAELIEDFLNWILGC